jgi:hypothetical protein
MRIAGGIPVATAIVAVMGLVVPQFASGRHSQVAMSVGSALNAGTPTAFSWTAHRAPRSSVVIQRQEGTSHAWRTVLTLGRASAGSATLPALGIGQYHIRIANLDRHGRVLAARQVTVSAFGDVPFSQLFGGQGGVETTKQITFPYALWYYNGETNYTAFTVAGNTCRSVHLEFVPDAGASGEYQHATATIVQQSSDPIATTVSANSKGIVDASVIPGQSWAVNLAQVPTGHLENLITWYLNGTANCYTTTLSI